jgi:hypothetical protein
MCVCETFSRTTLDDESGIALLYDVSFLSYSRKGRTHTLSLCMKRWELSSTAVHPIEIDHIHRLNQHIQRVIVVVNRCSSTFYPRDIYHRLMKLSCTPFV